MTPETQELLQLLLEAIENFVSGPFYHAEEHTNPNCWLKRAQEACVKLGAEPWR